MMYAERVQRVLESEARRHLASALASVPGSKAIVVDDSLYDAGLSVMRPLDLFTDATFLREHGIRTVTPLSANSTRLVADVLSQPAIVIIIRGVNTAAARSAVTIIRSARQREQRRSDQGGESESVSKSPPPSEGEVARSRSPSPAARRLRVAGAKCLVLTTPRRSMIIEKVFKSAQLGDVPVSPLPFGFLPFDDDLVTLDWPEAYRQVVLEGDNSAILACAAGLGAMASALNLEFATIRSAGVAATAVAEELLETHGQMYPSKARTADDTTLSTQSSPIITPQNGSASFVAHTAFTLDASSAKGEDEIEIEEGDNSSGDTMTLAQVTGNAARRRAVALLIVDRGTDVVTPMLTQWTYEGLLDEAVGLHNNVMDLPVSSIQSEDAMNILSAGPNGSGTVGTVRKRLRGDVDRIFGQLRDLNYWAAARQIGSVANSVRAYYERRPTRETAEISQMKDYVKGLREVKTEHWSAAAHTAIAAEISARTFDTYEFKRRFELEREMLEGSSATGRQIYVTDAIARGESLSHILRLCCVWSVTSSGIDSEEFEIVRRELLATYGLGVLPLLANIERAGMMSRSTKAGVSNTLGWLPLRSLAAPSETGSVAGSVISSTAGSEDRRMRARAADYSWQFARAALRLVMDFDPDRVVKPGSAGALASPYSGYTPLSVRLVEAGLSVDGWGSLPSVAAHTSLLPPGHVTVEHRRGEPIGSGAGGAEDGLDAVIVFVGGVARAEASAVRLAAQAVQAKVIIATTAVMGPDEFVLSLNDASHAAPR